MDVDTQDIHLQSLVQKIDMYKVSKVAFQKPRVEHNMHGHLF